MARRDLGDVLHFFISEDEQREARRDAGLREAHRAKRPTSARRAARWCVPVPATRPLLEGLAWELAGALASPDEPARVIASAARGRFAPRTARVLRIAPASEAPSDLARALVALAPATPAIVLTTPEDLASGIEALADAGADTVVVPVEAGARGQHAAEWLLGHLTTMRRPLAVGLLAIGGADEAPIERVRAAVRERARALEVETIDLGWVRRDRAADRALLAGRTIIDLSERSSSAQALRDVAGRLNQGAAA